MTASETANPAQQSDPAPVRIFIVAERDIYVDGLLQVIRELPDLKLAACINPGGNCITSFQQHPSDLLMIEQSVLESRLAHTAVDTLLDDFLGIRPKLRIIVFGRSFEESFIHRMIRGGAHGFIDSKMTREMLGNAILEVSRGGYWVSRKALREIICSVVEMERIVEQNIRDKVEAIQDDLTCRENDVLRCVMEGLSTREIADRLSLSEQSVKLHLGRLFRKFEVSNRSQLILMAFTRVCPVSNMFRLFRSGLDRHRIRNGKEPLICDPLDD